MTPAQARTFLRSGWIKAAIDCDTECMGLFPENIDVFKDSVKALKALRKHLTMIAKRKKKK